MGKHIFDIRINDVGVSQVSSTKFLGVIVNETLTWKDHIQIITNKVSKGICILYKVSSILPHSVLKSLYYALIHPYLEYCNIIWASKNDLQLNKLFLKQKRAIRAIYKFSEPFLPIFEHFKCL